MQLMEWLKKNEKLVFWNRCRLHCNEPKFRKWVVDDYNNHQWVKIESYGSEYRGKMIYQIEAFGCAVGFFAEFLYALIRLYYATERGFTPYIHWGEDFLYYEPDGIRREYNAFQYYFESVSEVSNIEKASYVIRATDYHIHDVQNCLNTHGYAVTKEYMDGLSAMIKKYIRYNSKTREYLENGYEDLIGDKKALAVHFRGTDYRRQYNNHPTFVSLEQEIAKVKELLENKNYEVIFLATDEQEAVNEFRQAFGDKVKCFEDTWRAAGGDESVAYSHAEREQHKYRLGLEVLRDQYMLTRCRGLVCGTSNLTLVARMMRKAWYEQAYEDLVIIDNGLCQNDKNFCDAKH